MFTGIIYGKTITAESLTVLMRKASIIANGFFNPIDEMTVTHSHIGKSKPLVYRRINKKYPNNTISRGQWK